VKPTLHVQAASAELPVGEFELVGQTIHNPADTAPAVAEYVPEKQLVHPTEPVVVLYFPATQAVHGPPSGPVYPALQAALRQAALDVLAVGEVKPAGHTVHCDVPVLFLYVPVAHAVHGFPEGHVVSVRSTPFNILLYISLAASVVSNSSTTNRPAMSPLKYLSGLKALPM
jgi:hypothetical protein